MTKTFDLEKSGPRDLFPGLKDQRGYPERRDYIEATMLELIEADNFYLTEIMLQGQVIKDACGDILFGHTFTEEGVQESGQFVDTVLEQHKIHLKSINDSAGRSIRYRHGSKPSRSHMLRSRGINTDKVKVLEAHYVDTEVSDGLISLPAAYRCMKTAGKFIKYASARSQDSTWLVEEVPPWSPEHAKAKDRLVPAQEVESKSIRRRKSHGQAV